MGAAALPRPEQTPRFEPVPGAEHVEWAALLNRPNITNANAFLLRGAEELVVVDVGTEESQLARLNALIAAGLGARRRVIVLLTHCHHDHVGGLDRLRVPDGVAVHHAIEVSGAEAIERGDTARTLAYVYPTARLPAVRFGARLFGTKRLPFPAVSDRLDLGDGLVLPRLSIPLAGGPPLEVLHTPGHSPCSVSLRLGGLLLLADLPAGASPGLAGLAGWSQPALLHSLAAMARLLARGGITVCGVGHGALTDAPRMEAALLGARRVAEGLAGVIDLDDARIAALKAFALDLLDEAATLFAAIAGQIHAVHYHLEHLEDEAAEDVLRLLDTEALDDAMADLQAFRARFREGQEPDLGIVLKAVARLQKVERLLRDGLRSGAVRASLARRAASLLGHFLAAVRGLDFPATEAPAAVDALAAEVLRDIEAGAAVDAEAVFAAAEDPEAFRRFLMGRLASTGAPRDVRLAVSGAPALARIERERFQDVLVTLLEALGRGGRRALDLSLAREGDAAVLRIRGRPAIEQAELPAGRTALLGRLLGVAGASVSLSGEEAAIRLPAG